MIGSGLITGLKSRLEWIQSKLSFEGWKDYPLFATTKSPGRAALLGAGLGCCLGVHACGLIGLSWWQFGASSAGIATAAAATATTTAITASSTTTLAAVPRIFMAWQWCAYGTALSIFHLAEYFITALYNPSQANSDSFLVNHSTGYTAAFLTSLMEFGIRFFAVSSSTPVLSYWWRWPPIVVYTGLGIVVMAQTIRSLAMITAGASFNHIIQTYKRKDHVLITHGIYSVLRHPSYVGFYYWSIGTQMLLGNPIHTIFFAVASWSFFSRRIPFEEESLCIHFPDEYPLYVARTWMGIPFLRSHIVIKRPSGEDG